MAQVAHDLDEGTVLGPEADALVGDFHAGEEGDAGGLREPGQDVGDPLVGGVDVDAPAEALVGGRGLCRGGLVGGGRVRAFGGTEGGSRAETEQGAQQTEAHHSVDPSWFQFLHC